MFLQNQIIMSMLCDKPEDRPEASILKEELEKWAQTFNAQNNMHQENVTVWLSQGLVIGYRSVWKSVSSDVCKLKKIFDILLLIWCTKMVTYFTYIALQLWHFSIQTGGQIVNPEINGQPQLSHRMPVYVWWSSTGQPQYVFNNQGKKTKIELCHLKKTMKCKSTH